MLTREAVAAALALAGIRSGAVVLDLTPEAGLTRAARAMAGPAGTIEHSPVASDTPYRFDYVLGVWADRDGGTATSEAQRQLAGVAPGARVILGSHGAPDDLVDAMRAAGWTVLHTTAVPDGAATVTGSGPLALAVARLPAAARIGVGT